jgi:predicted DNA-binding transcriptional regulator AlpA
VRRLAAACRRMKLSLQSTPSRLSAALLDDPLLDEDRIAAWLGIEVATLRSWSRKGGFPRPAVISTCVWRWRESVVMQWFFERERASLGPDWVAPTTPDGRAPSIDDVPLLHQHEIVAWLGISPATFRRRRVDRKFPVRIWLYGRTIVWREGVVAAWFAECERGPSGGKG